MPWCPNCGVEYRQGYKTCIDCKLDLVSEPRPMEETNDDDAGEAHLLSLTDLNLYMGTTAFGVDLYVPAKLLEEAREIVENNHQPVTESDQEIDEEYQYDNNKRKDRVWVIILFFIPGVFWLGIIVLFFIYFGMRQ